MVAELGSDSQVSTTVKLILQLLDPTKKCKGVLHSMRTYMGQRLAQMGVSEHSKSILGGWAAPRQTNAVVNEHYGNVPAYEDLLKHGGHDARVGYMVMRALLRPHDDLVGGVFGQCVSYNGHLLTVTQYAPMLDQVRLSCLPHCKLAHMFCAHNMRVMPF